MSVALCSCLLTRGAVQQHRRRRSLTAATPPVSPPASHPKLGKEVGGEPYAEYPVWANSRAAGQAALATAVSERETERLAAVPVAKHARSTTVATL